MPSPKAVWKFVLKPKLHHMKEKATKGVKKTQHNLESATATARAAPAPDTTTPKKSRIPHIPRSKKSHTNVKKPKAVPVTRI